MRAGLPMPKLAALLLAWALASPATTIAGGNDAQRLQPFRATYAATLNGMPMGVNVSVDLQSQQENWTLGLDASSPLMKYHEESRFRWQDCRATPDRYRFDFSGFGINRKLWLDFDHAERRASGESRKGPLSYAFPPEMTDELSLTMSARCHFAGGSPLASFEVATTKGMRRLSYRLQGKETVKTPWGRIEALRIERVRDEDDKRRSTLWIAPSLGYVMVKMEHAEKLGVRGSIALKTLEIASGPAAPLQTVAAP